MEEKETREDLLASTEQLEKELARVDYKKRFHRALRRTVYALVVAAGYQGAYCYAQPGVHDTGICSTTAEAWTPEKAWKEAK